jgi:hypothetical protein
MFILIDFFGRLFIVKALLFLFFILLHLPSSKAKMSKLFIAVKVRQSPVT